MVSGLIICFAVSCPTAALFVWAVFAFKWNNEWKEIDRKRNAIDREYSEAWACNYFNNLSKLK